MLSRALHQPSLAGRRWPASSAAALLAAHGDAVLPASPSADEARAAPGSEAKRTSPPEFQNSEYLVGSTATRSSASGSACCALALIFGSSSTASSSRCPCNRSCARSRGYLRDLKTYLMRQGIVHPPARGLQSARSWSSTTAPSSAFRPVKVAVIVLFSHESASPAASASRGRHPGQPRSRTPDGPSRACAQRACPSTRSAQGRHEHRRCCSSRSSSS